VAAMLVTFSATHPLMPVVALWRHDGLASYAVCLIRLARASAMKDHRL
jgi:hypothetical protein